MWKGVGLRRRVWKGGRKTGVEGVGVRKTVVEGDGG